MLGILAAQCLHAPNSVMIYESGTIDGKPMHIPGSVSDARACYMSSALGGLIDASGFYLQGTSLLSDSWEEHLSTNMAA